MNNKGVYQIKNTVNNKIYIGSSKHINKRWKEHINSLNNNCHCNSYLQKDWNKYGKDAFEFSVLENTEEYLEREQYYLDSLKPFSYTDNGYNICEKVGNYKKYSTRIYKNSFYRKNPFFAKNKRKVKELLKEIQWEIDNGYGDSRNLKYDGLKAKEVDTDTYYDWYDLASDECRLVGYGIVLTYSLSKIEKMTRQEIDDMMCSIATYRTEDEFKHLREEDLW